MLSGLTLSLNGNTITLAASLWHEVRMRCEGHTGAAQTARGLRAAIEARGGSAKLTLAVVHAFSTHMILLRTWLRAGGIDPDHDVRTIIVPPAQMVDSLATGIIDGYCVGEPWGSVAVHHGIGAIAAVGGDVWRNSPEKVLCVTQQWHARHPATHLRLRLALMEACAWLGDPGNRETAASLISTSRYLDLPSEWLLPSLTGRFRLEPSGPETVIEDFHVFDSEVAGFPWRSHTELLIAHCGELLGRPIAPEQARALAQQTARPDLFREGARHLGMVAPGVDRLDAHHAEILHQDRACDALMPSHGTRATPRPPRANR
jgi:ABC-type nitrate/sulfonate/bicarbonate transport system substrate-binding protein